MKLMVLALMMVISNVANAFSRDDVVYTVPVEAGLEDVAEFRIRGGVIYGGSGVNSGMVVIQLPEELTGVNSMQNEFRMQRGLNGRWGGQGVEGNCYTEKTKTFLCNVTYTSVRFDAVAREELLKKKFGTGPELDRRLKVARFFEGQPIGIIRMRID